LHLVVSVPYCLWKLEQARGKSGQFRRFIIHQPRFNNISTRVYYLIGDVPLEARITKGYEDIATYDIITSKHQSFRGDIKMDRVAIFIDGGAMFYAQRDNGWHLDYRNVKNFFSDNRELAGAYYFTATPSVANADALDRYRKFKHAMTMMGYNVKDKEVRVIRDENSGQTRLKGNLDIELVFRLLSSQSSYDIAVLLGGDSDYVPIIEHLVNNGKRVIVVGRRQSTATDLINSASQFTDLNDIRDRIIKTK